MSFKEESIQHKNIFYLVVVALLCTITAFSVSKKVFDYYNQAVPYSPDSMTGLLKAADLNEQLAKHNRFQVAWDELKTNPRDPFPFLTAILLAPKLLTGNIPQALFIVPFFFLFLFLTGLYLIKKKHSIFSATAIQIFYSTSSVFASIYNNVCFFLQDMMAAYPLACACICLLLWIDDKKNLWLISFSVLLGIAVLSRYIFSVYSFLLFSPLLVLSLYQRFRETKKFRSAVLKPALLIVSIIFCVCGYFIIIHFRNNFSYYSYWSDLEGVTMNFGLGKSFSSFIIFYFGCFGLIHSVIILLIMLLNVISFFSLNRMDKNKFILHLWLIVALPLYWIFILRMNGEVVGPAYLAAFPIMFIGILSLSSFQNSGWFEKKQIIIFILLSITSIFSFNSACQKTLERIRLCDNSVRSCKKLTVDLARTISTYHTLPQKPVVADFLGRCLVPAASLESFYNHGFFFKAKRITNYYPSTQMLSESATYLLINNDSVRKKILNDVLLEASIVVAYSDSSEILSKWFPDEVEPETFKYFSAEMLKQDDWYKKEFQSDFGFIAVYFKRTI